MRKVMLSLAVLLMAGSGAWALELGQKAPPVKVKWVHGKGKDPAKPDGKSIYVVEFWATWCGPCRKSIPHLNAMQDRFKDDNVVIMGISDEDEAKVKPFVDKMGMAYNVGVDKDRKTKDVYMKGVRGIPFAVIVNKDGKVAWFGHPLNGMERVLAKVVAGTFDSQAYVKKQQAVAGLQQQLQAAYQKHNVKAMLGILQRMIQADPENPQNYKNMIGILYQAGGVAQIPTVFNKWAEGCGEDPGGLAAMSAMLFNMQDCNLRDPVKALSVAKQAARICKGKDVTAILALAEAYARVGLFDKALKAIAMAKAKCPSSARQVEAMSAYCTRLKELQESGGKTE